jgi:hypothetical protein
MKFFALKGLRGAYARRYEPESMRRLAETYWGLIICAGGVLTVAAVGYGMWQFFVPPSDVASGDFGGGVVGFNRDQLKTIVETFEKQQADFERLMTGSGESAD